MTKNFRIFIAKRISFFSSLFKRFNLEEFSTSCSLENIFPFSSKCSNSKSPFHFSLFHFYLLLRSRIHLFHLFLLTNLGLLLQTVLENIKLILNLEICILVQISVEFMVQLLFETCSPFLIRRMVLYFMINFEVDFTIIVLEKINS